MMNQRRADNPGRCHTELHVTATATSIQNEAGEVIQNEISTKSEITAKSNG